MNLRIGTERVSLKPHHEYKVGTETLKIVLDDDGQYALIFWEDGDETSTTTLSVGTLEQAEGDLAHELTANILCAITIKDRTPRPGA